MNIEQIKGRIIDAGLARKNRFEILIPGFGESTFLATDCNMPSISISTNPYRTFPPLTQEPTDIVYEDLTVNFLVDANYNIRKLFQEWLEEILDFQAGTWAYRDDFVRDIQVNLLDEENLIKLSGNFIDCFPTQIGSLEKSFAAGDEIQTLPITFTYTYYTPL